METIFTWGAALLVGLLFVKLKVPGGMMVGAVVGTVMLSLLFFEAEVPYSAKFVSQFTAGAFIGCSVKRKDLKDLSKVYPIILTVICSFLILNLTAGFLLSRVSTLDTLTALLCAVPGGMSDVPLTAADMGADVTPVVIMQFTRLCVGIGLCPSWIVWLDHRRERRLGIAGGEREAVSSGNPSSSGQKKAAKVPKEKKVYDKGQIVIVMLVAFVGGTLGRLSGIPAGTLVMSAVGVLVYNICVKGVVLPMPLKRLAQLLSGAYIGCSVGNDVLAKFPQLVVPAVFITGAFLLHAYVAGKFLMKKFSIPFREAMLLVTPAGANDMALISADIGVQSPLLVVSQIIRMVTAASIFPQICYLLAKL